MKRYITLTIYTTLLFLCACKKNFLDVVPDNVATIDNAFANRNEAEKFLFTIFHELPQEGHPETNPAMNTGDECWVFWPITGEDYWSRDPYNIAHGLQNKVSPYMNYWDGFDRSPWKGIRNCNIFLENIDKPTDLDPYLKERWIAEVKFLKAYFHWYLFRMYGPIPVVDQNLPINAPKEAMQVTRQPVDSVVNYIAGLLDEAAAGDGNTGLPNKISSLLTELGRPTRAAALAIKARLLVTAASPLFNGNSDYANFKNIDGSPFFNPAYDQQKWERAQAACKEAIDVAEAAGARLYEFDPGILVVDEDTKLEMSIRNAICEKWNTELIWGNTAYGDPTGSLQRYACPQLNPTVTNLNLRAQLAPTLKMAELFYTKNGVPINEDKTWDYANRFNLRTTTASDIGLQNNYETVGLHFDREPRFYADIAFDGAKWFMRDGTYDIKCKSGEPSGKKQSRLYSITGYYAKKLVNWNLVATQTSLTVESYPWPVVRLADLYLLYAEAANETGDMATALNYLNKIRIRAGLNTVQDSWNNYSIYPNKYTGKTGLRSIIQQERMIEMAFEGSRFWDLKRWKLAGQYLNEPVYGWNITGKSYADYNRKLLLFSQTFVSPRDYFWPIGENNFLTNPNLVQNPGW